eukprot:GHVU01116057.1.p1 GENE.GHVU01116057.1~~GHVU01116057.1.p1  ORF type:complete len:731 (+),score=192.30 GHVU01116057.1:25-2193(+)
MGAAVAKLEDYISRVTVAYVNSRLVIAEAAAKEGDAFDDPLAADAAAVEQLEALVYLGRCKYEAVTEHVSSLFETLYQDFRAKKVPEDVFQSKVSWLVYVIGALLGGHAIPKGTTVNFRSVIPRSSADGYGGYGGSCAPAPTQEQKCTAKLAAHVFRLMMETDQLDRVPDLLELAYIYFLDNYRKCLLHEIAQRPHDGDMASEPPPLAKELGLDSADALLSLVVNKIATNLQKRVSLAPLVAKSVGLLSDLTGGVNLMRTDRAHVVVPGQLMVRNPRIQQLIRFHHDDALTFLKIPKYGRYRGQFMTTLAKLLVYDPVISESGQRDETQRFQAFMEPIAQVVDGLVMQLRTHGRLDESNIGVLVGVFRDIHGVLSAAASPEQYQLAFHWMLNVPKSPKESRIGLLIAAAEQFHNHAELLIPLLKLVSELAHNRVNRITFPQNSPSAIVLFREVSQLLLRYGPRLLERSDFKNVYKEKYKPISLSLAMFFHLISGDYVNFGVFELYCDSSFRDSMRIVLRMCLAIPREDLQAYLKRLKPFYNFLERATREEFIAEVMELDVDHVAQLVASVEEGLCAAEDQVFSLCCSITEHLVEYFFKHKDKPTEEGPRVQAFMGKHSAALRRILQILFRTIVSGEAMTIWSLSRPLLPLILLNRGELESVEQQVIAQRGEDRKPEIQTLFRNLMFDIEPVLDQKNKDTFSQNLYDFAKNVRMLMPSSSSTG